MVQLKRWIKLILIIMRTALASVGLFIFLAYKYTWYPEIVEFTKDGNAGVNMEVATYKKKVAMAYILDKNNSWEKNKLKVIKLWDWKNDGPTFRTTLEGISVYDSVKLMHSGERFAVINITPTINIPTSSTFLIFHLIPRALGKESMERWNLPGLGFAVAPYDESGIFLSETKEKEIVLSKYGWNKTVLFKNTIPLTTGYLWQPTFFDHDKKLAFKQIGEYDKPTTTLYIWDLQKNTIKQISSTDNSEVAKNINSDLETFYQNDHLYLRGIKKDILVE